MMSDVRFALGFTHDTVRDHYPMHAHHAVELVWHVGGSGVDVLSDGTEHDFDANSLVVHGQAALHGQVNRQTGIDRCLQLSVSEQLQTQIDEFMYLPAFNDSVLQQEFRFLSANQQQRAEQQRLFDLRAEAVLLSVLALREEKLSGQRSLPDKLADAERYMQLHFHESLSNADLAQQADLSEDYFRHQFKEVYGVSPMDYVMQLRIEHACRLLEHTSLKQQAIAEQSGFQNIRYFNTRFSHYRGISPGRYRRQCARA